MTTQRHDVFIDCPFSDKDEAKALGARFHSGRKSWFVPAGTPLEPFRKWLPLDVLRDVAPEEAPEERYGPSPDNAPQLTVREFVDGVRTAIMERYESDVWLIGQVTSLRERRNVWLIELMDPDQEGASAAHRLEVKAFGGQFHKIAAKLESMTGQKFEAGINVRIKVSPEFDPRYHLGARLIDIDPTVTIGAFELRLRQIREALKADGLYDRNRAMPAPLDFCRIAVIHPHAASGLADFQRDAAALERLGLCEIHYLTATFEGANAERSIVEAFGRARDIHERDALDAIVIIRGGGSKQGLMALSTEAIARALCAMPVPVITGFGHADDDTLLDELAWKRCDTPSKTIAFIRDQIRANALRGAEAFERIRQFVTMAMAEKQATTERNVERIRHHAVARLRDLRDTVEDRQRSIKDAAVRKRDHLLEQGRQVGLAHSRIETLAPGRLRDATARIEQLAGALSRSAESTFQSIGSRLDENNRMIGLSALRIASAAEEAVDRHGALIKAQASAVLERWTQGIGHTMALVNALGPDATLARGFAIVFDETGKAVTSAAAATGKTDLSLRFRDGSVAVRRV
jgi:exodeoxyribonuclease VII large subunit